MNSRLIILALLTMISIMAKAQTKIQLSVGTKTMTATLADNDATRTLVSKLKNDVRNETVYDLNGRLVAELPLPSGIYIVNGKKRLIR